MHNDSIETLLLRHYGNTAPTPPALEQRLLTSLRREAVAARRKQQITAHMQAQRLNRRRAVQLVALGSASIGLLGLGLDGLNTLGSNLLGADSAQPILP